MKKGSGKWFLALGGTAAGAAVIAAGIWIWGPEASETDFDQEVSALIFRMERSSRHRIWIRQTGRRGICLLHMRMGRFHFNFPVTRKMSMER